jgi:hypothetical protein
MSIDEERTAKNDHAFRVANERIQDVALEHEIGEPVPFLCECADPRCTTIIRISLGDFADVRSSPVRFVHATGHGEPEHTRVVDRRDGYDVIEKTGRAGEIAAELDGSG